ncbi:MAG TPA: saccharopine dehydrogenase C-terminal domain-containing protein [Dongiaceae bacterium]|nr:saccharopine dehydrogenase C-terminal domain-containing protein [Dongiaceae bacterium]
MAKKISYGGRILMIGYGSVGRCTMPLLEKHFDMPLSRITVVDADDHSADIARFVKKGVNYLIQPIVPGNLEATLDKFTAKGDLIINLSVEVSSIDIMVWCQKNGVLYLDTCIEPWANYYDNKSIPEDQRTNYYLRHSLLELAKSWPKDGPSALPTHGANPGLVSHFIKEALLDLAKQTGKNALEPKSREEWAKLMQALGVRVIHVAEHDLQVTDHPKRPNEFCNTWSIHGFVGEGCQPAELGWGTHEKKLPDLGHEHQVGCKAAIYLRQPGCVTEVRSWTPVGGPMISYLITHGESISTADYYTVYENGKPVYRPTVHYAYHPCEDAVLSVREFQARGFRLQEKIRPLNHEIVEGIDELGVLLMGDFGAYWYGSQLSIDEARELLGPDYNATSIQIASPVLAGAMWLIENPNRGVVEPEEVDYKYIMEICRPYLGPVVGERSDWTPLRNRNVLFPEPELDLGDPWQFENFRVRR